MIANATHYAKNGLPVFPLIANKKDPAVKRGFYAASTVPSVVKSLFENRKVNLGIRTGAESGTTVLDADLYKPEGAASYAELMRICPSLEDHAGKIVETPKGGKHLYFKYERGDKSTTEQAGFKGIDIRADGGYVVAPPSTINGVAYQLKKDEPLRPMPDAVRAALGMDAKAAAGNTDSILTSFGIAPNTAKLPEIGDIDRAKLSEALTFIESEEYEIWFKVGMALHPLGDDGFQIWDSWSAQSPKYPGQNELRGKWDSFKDGEGVGFGTVFHLAKQNGFVINPPTLSTADAPQTLHAIPFDIPKVFTELAVAEAVHKGFGSVLRYVPQTGKWHVVDEHNVWREDLTGKVDRCVVVVLKESKKYVCMLIMNGGNDKVNSLLREINKAEKYGFTVGTVSHLRSLEGMTMNSCHFDADPLLVGLAGGQVLDLRTSTVRPLLPEDYISKTLGTHFDDAATCPRWIQFIDEVTCGDKELAIYLQVVAGYCLSGLNELHVFWLMVGSGRNGKTVLLNTLMELLAEYAVMLPAEAITLRSNGGDNLSDLARLDRNRLAVTSEIAEGSHYNENRLKGLSGGDRITARRLYSEPYDFENRAKVLQAANYRPIVKGTDAAIWDRLQMVPFNAYFDKPDRQLTDKLKSELSGILNWCVAGWKIYQVKGLEIPAAVANESNAYKQEQDLTGQFLDQTCKVVVGSKIKSSELYARFKAWCLDNGFYVPNSSTFGRRIGNRLKSKREASGVFYLDVRMY